MDASDTIQGAPSHAATPSPSPGPSRTLRLPAALAVLLAAVLAAANGHGRASRFSFVAPRGVEVPGTAAVRDVTGALDLWQAGGVRGRRLILLTGRWSRPMTPRKQGAGHDPTAPVAEPIDVYSALFEASKLGVARRIDVVMPPMAYSRRLGDVMGQRGLEREASAFRLPFEGLERRFSTIDALELPAEPVLILVEPSWFAADAPQDPLDWLAARGVRSDLRIVALDDPAANDEQRRAALALASSSGAVFLEATGE